MKYKKQLKYIKLIKCNQNVTDINYNEGLSPDKIYYKKKR
jgi:hypothetical protein